MEYVFVDTVVITNPVTTLTTVSSVALMPQSGTLNQTHFFFEGVRGCLRLVNLSLQKEKKKKTNTHTKQNTL